MNAAETMARALIELTDQHQRPPCGHSSDQWLSEDREQRDAACHRCHDCQLIEVCGEYAKEIHASFGVFGGTDRTKTPRRTR